MPFTDHHNHCPVTLRSLDTSLRAVTTLVGVELPTLVVGLTKLGSRHRLQLVDVLVHRGVAVDKEAGPEGDVDQQGEIKRNKVEDVEEHFCAGEVAGVAFGELDDAKE